MQVYFARSIRGNHGDGDDYYPIVAEAIKTQGHTLAMEQPVNRKMSTFISEDQYIFERDLQWINESHALIAEVSNPSLGVGYEIAYAACVTQIPVLCVALRGTNVSAMITGSCIVRYYADTGDLVAYIAEFLKEVTQTRARIQRMIDGD